MRRLGVPRDAGRALATPDDGEIFPNKVESSCEDLVRLSLDTQATGVRGRIDTVEVGYGELCDMARLAVCHT